MVKFHPKMKSNSDPMSRTRTHLDRRRISTTTKSSLHGSIKQFSALFVWLISHQPAVLFSHKQPATNNQPAILFSENKSAPAISHQPNEQATDHANFSHPKCCPPHRQTIFLNSIHHGGGGNERLLLSHLSMLKKRGATWSHKDATKP
jgi:hypothetical protein